MIFAPNTLLLPLMLPDGTLNPIFFKEEVTFTDGKIYVRGRLTARGKKKRADYILYNKSNIPIALVEAKDNNHTIGAGMQQALEYARVLDIPLVLG